MNINPIEFDVRTFGEKLIKLSEMAETQKYVIDELKLKAAMYKAQTNRRYDLAEKLQNQITENLHNAVGEYDGFCYASWRAKAKYRTLDDMLDLGIITDEERRFCEV